jgi:serine/threonine protein kinase
MHLKKVLECLHHLHSRNIVHLDVNPDNIIVEDTTRNLKLVGFTHSKTLKPDLFAREPVFHDYGSPEYVAPEIVLNKPVTLNTDMWSVGVLAYQLLTGQSPYFGACMKDTLENIANNEWEAIAAGLADMSHDAKSFIHALLRTEPKDRLTVDQALAHPWISRACQQTHSVSVSHDSLVQLYSRHVWANQTRQKQPWLKTQRISSLLDSAQSEETNFRFEDAFADSTEATKTKKSGAKMTRLDIFAAFSSYPYPGRQIRSFITYCP